MIEAIENSLVEGYQQLIPSLTLPDADDRHVLAAAIKANAAQNNSELKRCGNISRNASTPPLETRMAGAD